MSNRRGLAVKLLMVFLLLSGAVGFGAASHALWLRHNAERANITVELAADLADFQQLARHEDEDETAMWQRLRRAGITSLAIPELTVGRLMRDGRASALAGSELLAWSAQQRSLAPALAALLTAGDVRAEHSYVIIPDDALRRHVEQQLCRRLRGACVMHPSTSGAVPVLEVPLGYDALRVQGMGIWPEDLAWARQQGFLVIPRLEDYGTATPTQIAADFAALDTAAVRTVIFGGKGVLGAAAGLVDVTAAAMKERGWTPGAIESVTLLSHWPQAGLPELVQALDYQAARVYSIAPEYQNQLTNAEMVEIWARSPWERNIRVLYVRPFLAGPAGQNLARTEATLLDTVVGLERAGFVRGGAGTFVPFTISGYHRFAMAALTIAAALGFLWRFGLLSPGLLLAGGLGAAAGWAALYKLGYGGPLTKLTALAMAVLAPLWAFEIIFVRWRRRWDAGSAAGRAGAVGRWSWSGIGQSAADLLVAAAVSLAGALVMAALLGDLPYLLEFDYFRGVKPALLLPPLAVGVLYVWHFGLGTAVPLARGRARLAAVLKEGTTVLGLPIQVGHALIGGLVLVAAFLVLVRSGNQTRAVVPDLELRLRSLLENLLAVRPRFKEFALGHPVLIIAGWLAARRPGPWLGLLAVVAAVGQASLVNTFAHLRTPLAISLARTGHGVWLGVLLGLAATLLLALVWSQSMRLGRVADPDEAAGKGM